ncbi:hypothetical protein PSECIP111854_02000 [Pseudoalteromonas sp. CIP111854]|uniref:Beta-N-acetylhexosaminidase n=1 Tax=Pseudoalteromonas holothuriae TaxID=2963714 RepID=A0A9W4QXI1_9GAMM|nr:beta-N-acetylhexosaminidase [Pseudoalteromonas sp. CIP111854]CAH9057456.1 hypothetical protein PSECIP111854_02000 [Pseudoalteromonas sp. CIP111854]
MNFFKAKLYAFFLSISLIYSAVAMCQNVLMPMPKHINLAQGELVLTDEVNVSFTGFSKARAIFQRTKLATYFTRIAKNKVMLIEASDKPVAISIEVMVPEQRLSALQLGDDESYELVIDNRAVRIKAKSVFGAQHALTTLVQLAKKGTAQQIVLPLLSIKDNPRFAWRGLLIDSARHFMPVDTIKRQLDGMSAAKLNVLHWHLTDDQGWRMHSKVFPKLTQYASDGLFYTQVQVKEIIRYASLLGIRVVPEFGMPGHASAIAVAYPEFMADIKEYQMQRHWGVFKPLLNIANPKVYEFIDKLLAEVTEIFPDKYLHIGGDEVEPEQWLKNEQIQQLMTQKQLQDGHDLQNYFNTQLQRIIAKHGRVMMGWDEIFHPQLAEDILVQSWRGHDSLYRIANAGFSGVLSTGFYIDQPQYSDYHYRNDPLKEPIAVDLTQPQVLSLAFIINRLKGSEVKGELLVLGEQVLIKLNDHYHRVASVQNPVNKQDMQLVAFMDSWMGPLKFEFDLVKQRGTVMIGNSRYPLQMNSLNKPQQVTLPPELKKQNQALILGAEATIWSEMVTADNIDLRIWPRLFVIAERLWSAKKLTNSSAMYSRLGTIDNYAANVIGLAHQSQQHTGFSSLINPKLNEQNKANTLQLLFTMAQMLEPSHYYTRHHIKYLNNQYHQQANLNSFVDFLAVESEQVRELNNNVARYLSGKSSALGLIESQLLQWQQVLETNKKLLRKPILVQNHHQIVSKIQRFLEYSKEVIAKCKGSSSDAMLESKLLSLQALTDETVIAGIYPMRDLYLGCK